jgi:hypothetical protein
VIGIHNSWDESNSDRRGIPVSLILAVAKKHKIKLVPVDDITSEDEDDSDVDMLDISVIDLT